MTNHFTVTLPAVSTINQRLDQIKSFFNTHLSSYFNMTEDSGSEGSRILEYAYNFEPNRRFRWMASTGSYNSTVLYVRNLANTGNARSNSIGSWSGVTSPIYAHCTLNDTTQAGHVHFSLTANPYLATNEEVRLFWAKMDATSGRILFNYLFFNYDDDGYQSMTSLIFSLGSYTFEGDKQPLYSLYPSMNIGTVVSTKPLIGLKVTNRNMKGITYNNNFMTPSKTYKQIYHSPDRLMALEL